MPELGDRTQFFTVDASNTTISVDTMAPSTIDNSIRTIAGALARDFDYRGYKVTSTGTSTAIVVSYTVNPPALYDGQPITFVTNTTWGASPNLVVGSLTSKAIKKHKGSTLQNVEAGDVQSGQYVALIYRTSPDCYVLVNPSQPISNSTTGTNYSTRLPDGTQICSGTVSVPSVANTPSSQGVTFARSFSSTTGLAVTVSGNNVGPGTSLVEASFSSLTTTGFDAWIYKTNATATTVSYQAIGRWY
jgi:hypothetical protein